MDTGVFHIELHDGETANDDESDEDAIDSDQVKNSLML